MPANTRPTTKDVEFLGPEIAHLYANTGGPSDLRQRVWSGLAVQDDDLVAEKTAASAFFPGRCDLHSQLRARAIDTVLVVGTVTHVCCESSVRHASTLGYRVVMVADLTIGGSPETRSSTFTVVYRTFGDVRTSHEVAGLLTRPFLHTP